MKIAVRWAGDDDAPVTDELLEHARAEARHKRHGPLLVDEPVSAGEAEPCSRTAVVSLDDLVVGLATAHVATLASGTRLCSLSLLYVEEEARGVGVGEALLDFLLTFARDEGCEGVDIPALPGDRETKNFLERAGFSARLLTMHRPLAGP